MRTSYIYKLYLYVKPFKFRGGGGGVVPDTPLPTTTTSNFDENFLSPRSQVEV